MSLDDVPRINYRPGMLDREERKARETVAKLRPKAKAGDCNRAERKKLREALGLLRRSEGYSKLEIRLRLRDGW